MNLENTIRNKRRISHFEGTNYETCLSCQNESISQLIDVPDWFGLAGTHRYAVCSSCGSWSLSEPSEKKEFRGSSQDFARTSSSRFAVAAGSINQLLMKRNFDRICKLTGKTEPGLLLDVGCGRGQFLVAAEDKGWKVCGIEPQESKFHVARLRVRGELHNATLEEVNFHGRRFDLILLWHVFEHIVDSEALLDRLGHVLAPGGVVVIAVPNILSFQARLFGRRWFHIGAPVHLYQFSKRGLVSLFSSRDYKCVGTGYFDTVLNFSGWLFSFCNSAGFPLNFFWHKLQKSARVPQRLDKRHWMLVPLLPLFVILSIPALIAEALMRKAGCLIAAFTLTQNNELGTMK